MNRPERQDLEPRPTVILRLFNVYGPGEYPGKYRNVIPNFLYRVLTGQPLVITGTGEETRDYTFNDDTVAALRLAMITAEAVGETLNVGSGCETTIRELADTVLQVCGSDRPIEFRPRRSWDTIISRLADIMRAHQVLGYRPTVTLRDGLERTYQWFIEQNIPRRPVL